MIAVHDAVARVRAQARRVGAAFDAAEDSPSHEESLRRIRSEWGELSVSIERFTLVEAAPGCQPVAEPPAAGRFSPVTMANP